MSILDRLIECYFGSRDLTPSNHLFASPKRSNFRASYARKYDPLLSAHSPHGVSPVAELVFVELLPSLCACLSGVHRLPYLEACLCHWSALHSVTWSICWAAMLHAHHPVSRTCFLSFMTLNRSKSLSSFLRMLRSLLFWKFDACHFSSTLCSAHCFLSAPVPAARGSLGMTIPVRDMDDSGAEWRGTTCDSSGPSTRTCGVGVSYC